MAWLGGNLIMPQHAGPPRAGGPRLQMPNVRRMPTPGGIGWCFAADAILMRGGEPLATLGAEVPALCDDGGVALAIDHQYYVVYAAAAAPGMLRACRQEAWAATYAAQDCIGLAYLTDHYDLYLPLGGRAAHVALQSSAADRALPLWIGPGGTHTALVSDDNSRVLPLWIGAGTGSHTALISDANSKVLSLTHGVPERVVTTSDPTTKVISLWR